MHADFSGMGSGYFLAVELNTNEEKWETGLGHHGKYEKLWKTSAQGLIMLQSYWKNFPFPSFLQGFLNYAASKEFGSCTQNAYSLWDRERQADQRTVKPVVITK